MRWSFKKRFSRSQYKEAWNAVSAREGGAKRAVSGYEDEALYKSTGEGTRDMLRGTVGLNPEDVVLEIGAGVGRVGATVAPLCKTWIGVDVSENMLKHLRRRLAHLPNVRALASNGYDLAQVESQSVDVVYSTVVFMHLDEWDRYNYVREGFRVLKPGGRMLVDNVDLTSDAGWAFFADHLRVPPRDRNARISKTSTPEELGAYFMRAGFEGIEQGRWDLWVVTWGRRPGAPRG